MNKVRVLLVGIGGYGQTYSRPESVSRPTPGNAISDGFMNIPDGVDDEGLPFN